MRIVKFRGKRVKDGKWIYGNLADYSFTILRDTINKKVIFSNIVSFATDNFGFVVNDCEVAPDTVGQFTGLLDKNGKEIYEGDIISLRDYIAEVRWNSNLSAFCIRFSFESELGIKPLGSWIDRRRRCNVIGNIHDNPELLNEK